MRSNFQILEKEGTMKKTFGILSICAVLAMVLWLPATARAEGVVKIGAMATLEGPFCRTW